MKKVCFLIFLLFFLFQSISVLAMSSAGYKLDWFTPLTGNGGGPMSSAHYSVNVTVGQSVSGGAVSAGYKVQLGYWAGMAVPPVFLPLILRN